MDKTIYYPYNESFKYYDMPKAGKRAQQFIDDKNQCLGGYWVLHTKEQYDKWYQEKGKHLETNYTHAANLAKMGVRIC